MEALDAQRPNEFTYHLARDPGMTGNFEVTLHNSADCSDQGTKLHSKKATGKFPMNDESSWDAFTGQL